MHLHRSVVTIAVVMLVIIPELQIGGFVVGLGVIVVHRFRFRNRQVVPAAADADAGG